MQPGQFPYRTGEQPERILVAQVGLLRKGQALQVVQAAHVVRVDAQRVQPRTVQRHVLVGVLQRGAQAPQLQFGQLVARHAFKPWFEHCASAGLRAGHGAATRIRLGHLIHRMSPVPVANC